VRLSGLGRRLASAAALALVLAAPIALTASPAPAASQAPASSPADARLQGTFAIAGRVTTADNVRGEHAGETVSRKWVFMPKCQAGACGRIELVRTRAGGKDRLVLHRHAPGYYVGTGSFYAALRCGSHLWHRGEYVPFRITVRITAAKLVNGVVVATRVRAFYLNRGRTNKTPCVAVLGHDAARYHGHLVQTAPPGGASGRSPAGS
jgi:hypothetical protein